MQIQDTDVDLNRLNKHGVSTHTKFNVFDQGKKACFIALRKKTSF